MTYQCFTGGFVQTNAWLLSHGDRHVLVDAPEDVAQWLRDLGVKIGALLLTHHHFDHVQGAAQVVADHGCPVYAFTQPSPELWLTKFFPVAIDPYPVTDLLEGKEHLLLLGEKFTLFHVPGHSPDSVCFYHKASALCACGDTILPGSHGRTDFPGGDEEQLLSGIMQHLLPLPVKTVLLPGHGEDSSLAEELESNGPLLDYMAENGIVAFIPNDE